MNGYNNSILNKTGLLIKERFNQIDWSKLFQVTDVTIKDNTINDLHYYVSRGETAAFDMWIHYTGTWIDKDKVSQSINSSIKLRIPKLMDNIFIIKGKYRAPIISMVGDYDCRFREGVIIINWNTKYVEKDNTLKFIDVDTGEEKTLVVTEDMLDKYKKSMILKQEYRTKLSVKLNIDCPTHITIDLLQACLDYGSDMRKDFILDKKLITADESFYQYIDRSRMAFLRTSRSKLRMYHKFFHRDMQNLIDKFFNLQSAQGLSVQIPTGINPLAFDSIRSKVVVSDKVSYNHSFSDLIDPVNTPENNNVNKLNELNKGVSIRDGKIYLTCYTKNFERIELDYLDYLNSKVLKNRSADYVNKKIRTEDIQIKYRGMEYTGTDFEFIEPEPDLMLSTTTRRIPMINYSDSIRIAMGASMMKQAVELVNPEPPKVASGNDEEDIDSSTLVTKYMKDIPGTVTKIENSLITIKSEDGTESYFTIPNSLSSINNISTTFTTALKVGDAVKPGDAVVLPRALKNRSFDLGMNALTAFMIYRGYNNEDAVVVSESYSNRMAHYSILDFEMPIGPEDTLIDIIKIGTEVKSRDILVAATRYIQGHGSIGSLTELVASDRITKTRPNDLIVSNNVDSAWVSDIKVMKGSMKSNKGLDQFIKGIDYDKSSLRGKLPVRITSKGVDEGTDLIPEDYIYLVKIQLVQISKIKVGDKLCNRYGSKGVVSLIEPDDMMPRTVDGRLIEQILNPYSIIGRKNVSQIIEMYLALIADHFYATVNASINEGTLDLGATKELLQKYYGDRFQKFDKDTFIHSHAAKGASFYAFMTGSFTDLKSEDVIMWMKELGVEPEVKVIDGRTKKLIKNPILVGGMYTLKLYHLPEYSGKVTPTEMSKSAPMIGRGSYRSGGQSIGEMEMWALLSHGMTEFLDRTRNTQVADSYSLVNNLLMVGVALKGDDGIALGSHKKPDNNDI